jgi:cytochrome P450
LLSVLIRSYFLRPLFVAQTSGRGNQDLGSPLSASLLFFPILRQDLGPWSPWGKFVFNRGQIDRLIYDEIAERRGSMATTRS